ncbi:MAG: hypothetical protein L6420_05405 [Elusimicrobia bacterium]|nr:hypothetical protein [Elusimicrobiota bacterium]
MLVIIMKLRIMDWGIKIRCQKPDARGQKQQQLQEVKTFSSYAQAKKALLQFHHNRLIILHALLWLDICNIGSYAS